MIIDHRFYCTVYAVLSVAWFIAPFSGDKADRRMVLVLLGAVTVGLLNYLDWLWS